MRSSFFFAEPPPQRLLRLRVARHLSWLQLATWRSLAWPSALITRAVTRPSEPWPVSLPLTECLVEQFLLVSYEFLKAIQQFY